MVSKRNFMESNQNIASPNFFAMGNFTINKKPRDYTWPIFGQSESDSLSFSHFQRRQKWQKFRLALLLPQQGAAGIWLPSCLAAAQTAIAELNKNCGIGAREIDWQLVDAAHENSEELPDIINDMIDGGEIDAIIGMHISAVRQKLAHRVAGRIPYIYTPLYEGGELTRGVYTLGETPQDQLAPALAHIAQKMGVKRWALIGNNYVWPLRSHYFAKHFIAAQGNQVVYEDYIPLGGVGMENVLD